tara:strand:- start:587 stop:1099 length:513 start_codon:yes stop_codon:yes gene_type:complete
MVDTALLIDELDNLSPEDLDDDLSIRSEALSETSKEGSSAKRSWTEDEDQRLLKLVEEHGPRRWAHLSTMIPGRAGKQCRERCDADPANIPLEPCWSRKAKQNLRFGVPPLVPRRWHNHLRPTVKKEEWTEEEDRLIMDLVNEMGTKWLRVSPVSLYPPRRAAPGPQSPP